MKEPLSLILNIARENPGKHVFIHSFFLSLNTLVTNGFYE